VSRLTKRTVDAAVNHSDRDRFIWDDTLPGFGFRIKPSGTKSFFIQYRNRGGDSRRLTLGRYGVLTAEQARASAKAALAKVALGDDPAETRSQDRNAKTIADLAREYLDRAERGLIVTRRGKIKKPSTIYTDRGRIERHIIPLLGRRKVKQVTTADIRGFIRDVISGKTKADVKTKKRGRAIVKGGCGTAARTIGLLGAIFTYAIGEGYRADNPVRGVPRPADEKRDIRFDRAGYRKLGEALANADDSAAPWQAILAIKVIALTAARRGEIETLKRSEVNLTAQALRLGDSKTGRSLRPLGNEAVRVLRAALLKSSGQYVFPSDRTKDSLPKAWRRIVGERLPGITPHGLRHAFASMADDLGFTLPTIGALLGHAGHGVTVGYIHKPDPVLVSAANRISRSINRAMSGAEEENVIELKTA
jgi:integrase